MVCNPLECRRAPMPTTGLHDRRIQSWMRSSWRSPHAPAAGWSPSGPRATRESPTAVQERQNVRQPYPNYRVIVLDDNINTFQHVVDALVRHLPGMQPDRAWELAHRIDGEGSAVVWRGPQEQAELYHQLLGAEGLTMAPLERD